MSQQQQAETAERDDQADGDQATELDRAIATYDELRDKADAVRSEVDELDGERRKLVLKAETGDDAARKRVTEIDRKLPGRRQRVADLDAAIEQQADAVAAAQRAEDQAERQQRLADLRQAAQDREAELATAEDHIRRAAAALANADAYADQLRRAAPRHLVRDGADPLSRDRIANRLQDCIAGLIPGAGVERTQRPIDGDAPEPQLIEPEQRAHAQLLSEIEAEVGAER